MSNIDKAIQWATAFVQDASHGYSQDGVARWDSQCDCSSLMYRMFQTAGYPIPHGLNDRSGYTGSMVRDFSAAGFAVMPFTSMDNLVRGDVLLAPSTHTECYIGNGQVVAARGGTYSIYDYGHYGDQTGYETGVFAYRYFGQTIVLRPPDANSGYSDSGSRTKEHEMYNIQIGSASDRIIIDPQNKTWKNVVLPEEVQAWDNIEPKTVFTSEQLDWFKATIKSSGSPL